MIVSEVPRGPIFPCYQEEQMRSDAFPGDNIKQGLRYKKKYPPQLTWWGWGLSFCSYKSGIQQPLTKRPLQNHKPGSTSKNATYYKMRVVTPLLRCHFCSDLGGKHYKMADLQKQADAEHTNLPSTKCQRYLYNFQIHFVEKRHVQTPSQLKTCINQELLSL